MGLELGGELFFFGHAPPRRKRGGQYQGTTRTHRAPVR